jgi:hypothetical protein
MRRATSFILMLAILMSVPSGLSAKIPNSLLKKKKEPAKSIYGEVKKELKGKGYRKNVLDMKYGYIKPGFTLPEGLSVYVAPIDNAVKGEGKDLVAAMSDITRSRLAGLLKETELFSRVSTSDRKGADLIVRLKIMEVQSLMSVWLAGSSCLWMVDVHDKDGKLVLSGFDKLSSEFYGKDAEFLSDEIPIHALFFLSRNNPTFDEEYKKALRNRELIWFRK